MPLTSALPASSPRGFCTALIIWVGWPRRWLSKRHFKPNIDRRDCLPGTQGYYSCRRFSLESENRISFLWRELSKAGHELSRSVADPRGWSPRPYRPALAPRWAAARTPHILAWTEGGSVSDFLPACFPVVSAGLRVGQINAALRRCSFLCSRGRSDQAPWLPSPRPPIPVLGRQASSPGPDHLILGRWYRGNGAIVPWIASGRRALSPPALALSSSCPARASQSGRSTPPACRTTRWGPQRLALCIQRTVLPLDHTLVDLLAHGYSWQSLCIH